MQKGRKAHRSEIVSLGGVGGEASQNVRRQTQVSRMWPQIAAWAPLEKLDRMKMPSKRESGLRSPPEHHRNMAPDRRQSASVPEIVAR